MNLPIQMIRNMFCWFWISLVGVRCGTDYGKSRARWLEVSANGFDLRVYVCVSVLRIVKTTNVILEKCCWEYYSSWFCVFVEFRTCSRNQRRACVTISLRISRSTINPQESKRSVSFVSVRFLRTCINQKEKLYSSMNISFQVSQMFINLKENKHLGWLYIVWVLENDHKPNENFILWVSPDDFGFWIEASFGTPMG